MKLIPILVVSAALLGVVALMAGDRDKAVQAVRNIAIVVVGMLLMAALFSLITARRL